VNFISPKLFWLGRLTTVGLNGVVRIEGAPFRFDPSMGNLIMDLWRTPDKNAAGQPIAPAPSNIAFLGQTGGYDPNGGGLSATDPDWQYRYSRVSNYWNPMDQSQNMNQGLVVGFDYDMTSPEPGTFALLAGGLGVALALARRRRKASR
jgi:hypothetical protein